MNRKQRRAAKRTGRDVSGPSGQVASLHTQFDTTALFEAAYNYYQNGKLAEAEKSCRALHAIDAAHAGASHILGLLAHRRGEADTAIRWIEHAIKSAPRFAVAYNNLGVILSQAGRIEEAVAAYRNAIEIDPKYATAYANLGSAFVNLNRPEDAVAPCCTALELRPDYAEAHYNLGTAFYGQGRAADAVTHFEKALELEPHNAKAKFALCMAELPILFADESEIDARRAAYARRLHALVGDAGRPLAALSEAVGLAQPFQLAYQGHNDCELQRVYGDFVSRIMAERYSPVPQGTPAATGERVRVGVVSGYFRRHSNWKIPIKGWLSQLDRARFEIIGFHTGVLRDEETEAARVLCDKFVQGPLTTDEWRRTIISDAPHVLIYPEIGMDPVAVRLAAQRLAPTQCNSWGHPETSGLPTMDYYLSSDLMEPSDAASHYTEQLVRLPGLSIYYEPPDTQPIDLTRSELGLRDSVPIFWCGQSLFKYLPQLDWVFPSIARSAGACQFVFIHFPQSVHIKTVLTKRLERAFRAYGLNHEDYCVILPYMDARKFTAVIGQCDIVLDSIGWSGCNSTLESLQWDLPVVTMPGTLMRGRHTEAILTAMDVRQTIAADLNDYVAIAVRLAKDRAWRLEVKAAISQNRHRLYRDKSPISALEIFLTRVASEPRQSRAV